MCYCGGFTHFQHGILMLLPVLLILFIRYVRIMQSDDDSDSEDEGAMDVESSKKSSKHGECTALHYI